MLQFYLSISGPALGKSAPGESCALREVILQADSEQMQENIMVTYSGWGGGNHLPQQKEFYH